MKELYEIKDRLCDELKGYAGKEISAGALDDIDKLSHALKNLDKVIEGYEHEDYSNRGYSRGRDSHGRYSRGYSYTEDRPNMRW